jgi:ribosomal protein S18 acetylase RimI-like enzyme
MPEEAQMSAPRWRVTTGRTAPDEVARLLARLPSWFGIEASNAEYVQRARELPAYLAWPVDERAEHPAGALLAIRHFPKAAEVYLLAVDPAVHRNGAGRALLGAAEFDLAAHGVEFLHVKTLGPAHPDAGYAKTRAFYAAMGFTALEEIHGLWDPGNPCLLMVKTLSGEGRA